MSEVTSPGMNPVDTQHGDDVDVRSIVVWGLVSVFFTLASIFALHAMYNMFAAEQRVEKSYNASYTAAAGAIDQQSGTLQQPPRWMDQEGKTVGVPIDMAMAFTVQQYEQKKD